MTRDDVPCGVHSSIEPRCNRQKAVPVTGCGPVFQTSPLIAILDDEPQMGKALSRLLRTHGLEVTAFTDGRSLLEFCASRLPDCLLLDLHMPIMSGFDLLECLAGQRMPFPVIVITGHDQPGNEARVRALGAMDYLLKPLNEPELMAVIERVIPKGSPFPVPAHIQSRISKS
ncbi:MAG: response regulator [Opitutaceae bacterium]